jgi:pimeloyl-ACP methyl ester carboxylesterase
MRSIAKGVLIVLTVLWPTATSAQDRFLNSNGVRIRYVDQGKGTGAPIVLIHGFASSVEGGWVDTGVLSSLAANHRVVAADLRGHGKSDKPHDPTAYGIDLVDDVVRLLDTLNIPRAHIVGYSLGAVIAAKLLATHPERCVTVTLGGSSGRRHWTEADERSAQNGAAALESDVPYRGLIVGLAPTDQAPPSEEFIRARSKEIAARNDPLAQAALTRAGGGMVVSDAQMIAARVPTLAIIGSADPGLPGVNELKSVWPALNVVILDGAVHGTPDPRSAARRPEFVASIHSFIEAHEIGLQK